MSPTFSPGARLGHYEIKSQIVAGGMGVFALNPIWDDLRDDPRFTALIRKVEQSSA